MKAAAFVIEVSDNGRAWRRCMRFPEAYARVQLAYADARTVWVDSSRLLRTAGICDEYSCVHVRIVKVGSNRAAHRFPPRRTVYRFST